MRPRVVSLSLSKLWLGGSEAKRIWFEGFWGWTGIVECTGMLGYGVGWRWRLWRHGCGQWGNWKEPEEWRDYWRGLKNAATSWQSQEWSNHLMDELGCRLAFKLEGTREENGMKRSSATDLVGGLVASEADNSALCHSRLSGDHTTHWAIGWPINYLLNPLMRNSCGWAQICFAFSSFECLPLGLWEWFCQLRMFESYHTKGDLSSSMRDRSGAMLKAGNADLWGRVPKFELQLPRGGKGRLMQFLSMVGGVGSELEATGREWGYPGNPLGCHRLQWRPLTANDGHLMGHGSQ